MHVDILIVEDDSGLAELIREELAERGWSAEHAESGAAAREWLGQHDARLVLLDNSLPDVRGIDLVEAGAFPPFVVITGNGDERFAVRMMKSGARDYLIKDAAFLDNLPQVIDRILRELNTEQHLAEAKAKLAASEQRYRQIVETTADGIFTYDEHGVITFSNRAATAMLERSEQELVGRPLAALIERLVVSGAVPAATDLFVRGFRNHELRLHSPQGRPLWVNLSVTPFHDEHRRTLGGLAIVNDITHRKEFEAKILQLANYDALTGLANRNLLIARTQQSIKQATRHGDGLAILFIDVDRFKTINDSLGHSIGDSLLIRVAERLRDIVRENDTVARLGGDEFVVLLAELHSSVDASRVAQKILDSLARPIQIDGHELSVSGSIGISLYPDDGIDADKLVRNADAAMYHAKGLGRNNYQYYTLDMNVRAHEVLKLENQLRRAIERGEFSLYYQPQIDTESGTLIGFEALIRWNHPDQGVMLPAHFIDHAEDRGFIVPIGEWVLCEACRQNQEWQQAGICTVPIAVNLSATQFRRSELRENIASALGKSGLSACYLQLEVTESVVMHDADSVIAMLANLRELGIRLAIDDFGTGYSSLSYLRKFPIDSLKIDRSFIREIATNRDDQAIVDAIIRMAHSLNVGVLAEGVETQEQLDFLRSRGCQRVQGFLFSTPLAAADVPEFVRRLTTLRTAPPIESSPEPGG